MNHWDNGIGFWLKDIPYIWKKNVRWEKCKRIYLISPDNIILFDKIVKKFCSDKRILNYFQYSLEIEKGSKLKINGNDLIYKPRDVYELYVYLDIIDKYDIMDEDDIQIINVNYDLKMKVECGIKMPEYLSIDNLVCSNINSYSYGEFFEGTNTCTTLGRNITQNLIRVATSRIFTNPVKSLYEPIANSIDSFRGGERSIGKFGMGFFSLLWWLEKKQDSLKIRSVYKQDAKTFCVWSCDIKKENDNYVFKLDSELKKSQISTGTTVKISLSRDNTKRSKLFSFENIFTFIEGINVSISSSDIFMVSEQNIGYDPLNDKNISVYISKNTPVISIEFTDNADGIPLKTFLNKTLVPGISSKIIGKKSTRLSSTGLTRVVDMKDANSIILCIAIEDYIFLKFSQQLSGERGAAYILSLPHNIPLPVSRDDIILTNPDVYDLVKKEYFKLIEDIIHKKRNLNILFNLMKKYAEYSKDVKINMIIEEGYDFIHERDNIIEIPIGYFDFYDTYISPHFKTKIFLESARSDYEKIRKQLKENMVIYQIEKIANRTLVIVDNMKTAIFPGGMPDILFVNKNLIVDHPDDWVSRIILQLNIYAFDNGYDSIEDKYKSLFSSLRRIMEESCYILNKYNLKDDYGENIVLHKSNKTQIDSNLIEVYDKIFSHVNRFYDLLITFYQKVGYTGIVTYNYLQTMKYSNFILFYVYEILATSYIISNGDDIFLKKMTDILYSFLNDFPTREMVTLNSSDSYIYLSSNYYIKYYHKWFRITNIESKNINLPIIGNNYFKLKAEKEKDSVLNYVIFFFKIFSELDHQYTDFKNPFENFFLTILNYCTDKAPPSKNNYYLENETGYFFKNFFININYIYWPYLTCFLNYVMNEYNENINFLMQIFPFIYKELTYKHEYNYLMESFKNYMRFWRVTDVKSYSNFDNIVGNLVIAYKIFKSALNVKISHKFNIRGQLFTNFRILQLLNYVFEKDVNMDDVTWMKEIQRFKESHDSKFQILEMVINEGTSKSYIDSVLTETIQNSIDASRMMVKKHDEFVCFMGDEIFQILPNGLKIPAKLSKNDDMNPCPTLTINCGEIVMNGKKYQGLSITDLVGIPTKGIISVLIPFLSTKTSQDVNATGEMGTGFMNVFRYPHTKKVIIQTRNPDDGLMYTIKAKPIISNMRVVDVSVKLFISSDEIKLSERKTEIIILFNYENNDALSELKTDVELYCNKFMPVLNIPCYYNEKWMTAEKHMILNIGRNDIGTVHYIETDTPSVILTNGIPFDDLINYEYDDPLPWVSAFSNKGIVVNFNKEIYVPSQSRKRMTFGGIGNFEIDTFLKNAIYNYILICIEKNPLDTLQKLTYIGSFEGIDFKGDPRQYSPSISGNSFINFFPNIMEKKCNIAMIISKINKSFSSLSKIPEKIDHMLDTIFKDPETYLKLGLSNLPQPIIYMVKYWYRNKKFEEYTTEKKVMRQKDAAFYKNVQSFVQNLINQLWSSAHENIKKGLIEGIHPKSVIPPVFKIKTIKGGANGLFDLAKNKIYLDYSTINPLLEKDIDSLRKLKNRDEIIKLLKQGPGFNSLFGTNTSSSRVLVHELCHALLGEIHEGSVHSDFTLKTRYSKKTTFLEKKHTFNTGANVLFSFLLPNYKPN